MREPESASSAPIPKIPDGFAYRSPKKNIEGMVFDYSVKWLKFTGIREEIGLTPYMVLEILLGYDLRFRENRDEPFYFNPEFCEDPIKLIADQAGVEKEHIQRGALPTLKEFGFLDYWTERGEYRFKVNWSVLSRLYRETAYGIPFIEDGLKGIPGDFSGVLRPTPFHSIYIQEGCVVPRERVNKLSEKTTEGD